MDVIKFAVKLFIQKINSWIMIVIYEYLLNHKIRKGWYERVDGSSLILNH